MNNPSLKKTVGARLDAADITVLIHGAIAALLGAGMQQLMAHRAWPWGHPFALYFLLQWLALMPLAAALLSGMKSRRRWLTALGIFGVLLPLVTAYGMTAAFGSMPDERGGWAGRGETAMALLLAGMVGFVLLALVQALDVHRPRWNYPAIFRAAWRNAVHLGLSLGLALCVFLLMAAAGAMFDMIGIRIVRSLVEDATFRFAVWPMVLAACLVGVRRRPALTNILQRAWLTLNAWLLPLVTAVGLAFTVALAARLALGLQAVQLSAGALIAFLLVWIKLINAAWQDGPQADPFGPGPRRLLRWAMVCLLPLAAVALTGAVIRVEQYGWTVLRAWGVGAAAILVLYGVGYAWAAIRGKHHHAALAATNLVAALATVALLLALATPLANPLRLTAESQFQRLVDGRKDPEDFSFHAMGRDYGVWGHDALRRLADGAANAREPRIAEAAKETLQGGYFRWDAPLDPARDQAPDLAVTLAVTPAGRDVPVAWWRTLRREHPALARACVPGAQAQARARAAASAAAASGAEASGADASGADASGAAASTADAPPVSRCRVIFADLTGDGADELVLYVAPQSDTDYPGPDRFSAFTLDAADQWRYLGDLHAASFEQPMEDVTGVDDVAQALKQGLVRTRPRADRDLLIGDQLLRLR
ncbi:MAG: DUF4153 domain-containing protein [Achromobacter sp.]|uniref:DUF4153 domain-containing protein n=1 Tax=Achromobacter sp. TaxID=134375 RepID=UPI0029BA2AC3|nr:DUF4153 domain-containing protein [Achromobacter sp.]MDX3988225.1 DUF4153 domain-containing protein [Achromobacter sp.]